MRRLPILLLLVLAVPETTAARRRAVVPAPPLPVEAIDAIGLAHTSENPGLAIAVKKGNALYLRGFGVADRATNAPVYGDSEFQIASVSKQFAAAAILRLAEEGKLSVDDRARKYLPELDERFDAITIRHLLNHTSGVRDYNSQLKSAYEPKTQQQILALITVGPPIFPAGTIFHYSNSGYFLLGMIIERIAARSFEQYLRETFFAPLGLGGTSYCGTFAPTPDGYYAAPDGTLPELPAAHMSLVFSAGAICSNAYDLVRWNDALVSGAAVSPASYARMTSETVEMIPGIRYGFGLVVDRFEDRRRIWHDGSILGFSSFLAWFPDEDLTIVVLINVTDLQRNRPMEIAAKIAKLLKP